MKRLNDCAAKLPPSVAGEVQRPLNWMNAQFERATQPISPDYRESLERDIELCELALKDSTKTQLIDDWSKICAIRAGIASRPGGTATFVCR